MSLADDLADLVKDESPACAVCHHLNTLTGKAAVNLRAAVDGTAGYKLIGRACRKNGLFLPDDHVRVHRNEKHQP